MKKISNKTKFMYCVGNLGYGTISQTMSNFIMFFATSILGISGTLVGIAVAISAFWDGLSDPLVGYLSDRHKNKIFGRRLGFMLIATFGMAFFNILLSKMHFFKCKSAQKTDEMFMYFLHQKKCKKVLTLHILGCII